MDDLPFSSTKALEPLNEIIGQSRAQQALHFAMAMPDNGYNIYAVGRNGLGKRTMMLRYLNHKIEEQRERGRLVLCRQFRGATVASRPKASIGHGFDA